MAEWPRNTRNRSCRLAKHSKIRTGLRRKWKWTFHLTKETWFCSNWGATCSSSKKWTLTIIQCCWEFTNCKEEKLRPKQSWMPQIVTQSSWRRAFLTKSRLISWEVLLVTVKLSQMTKINYCTRRRGLRKHSLNLMMVECCQLAAIISTSWGL